MTEIIWVPISVIASELGVSRRTIARWMQGNFPRPRRWNNRLYFHRDEIEAWKAAAPIAPEPARRGRMP